MWDKIGIALVAIIGFPIAIFLGIVSIVMFITFAILFLIWIGIAMITGHPVDVMKDGKRIGTLVRGRFNKD